MWERRSYLLQPFTTLTSAKVTFKWIDVEQNAFYKTKQIAVHNTLLIYSDLNERFDIHMDASNFQLGAVIIQNSKQISFYSQKVTGEQSRYTVKERQLFSIVKTLKDFRTILLGQRLKIYTGYKNLTNKNFNTDRVLRWGLILIIRP